MAVLQVYLTIITITGPSPSHKLKRLIIKDVIYSLTKIDKLKEAKYLLI